MEFGNSTNNILAPYYEEMRHSGESDPCALHADICGMEAGCLNRGDGTFQCLCHHDLEPVGDNNSCDRTKAPLQISSTDSSITDLPSDARPTHGKFESHQLLGMLSPPTFPTNLTDGNLTRWNSTSEVGGPVPLGPGGPPVALVACLLAMGLVALCGGLFCFFRRNKAGGRWVWCGGRGRHAAVLSLSKCMQQYVANPNYYSSAPETPLLRALKELHIPPDSVQLKEEIGEGCFGKVHKGVMRDGAGLWRVPVAVKTLKEGATGDALAEFEREVEIAASFHHPAILSVIGVVLRDANLSPWMVFEFMQHGDLAQLLRRNCPPLRHHNETIRLEQSDLVRISSQIASGMDYLSSQHFVHRDLATRNCLVGQNLTVKISDFGMSRDIYTSDYYRVGGSRMLPIRWMAPESITFGKFSLESDIWAYGVVLWEIFTLGKQPYYGHSNDQVVKLILQGILLSPPENCPPFICNMMAGCWKTDPRHRIVFADMHRELMHYTHGTSDAPARDETVLLVDSDDYLQPTL